MEKGKTYNELKCYSPDQILYFCEELKNWSPKNAVSTDRYPVQVNYYYDWFVVTNILISKYIWANYDKVT